MLKKRKKREGSDSEEYKDAEGRNIIGANAHGDREKDMHHQDVDGIDIDDESYEGSLKMTKFIMKNGCCRECMKAFSKTGKSCLC